MTGGPPRAALSLNAPVAASNRAISPVLEPQSAKRSALKTARSLMYEFA